MNIATFEGARLRDARLAREMTASLLAERVGLSPGSISQYESGGTGPRPPVLARLAAVLELPQAYFSCALRCRATPAPTGTGRTRRRRSVLDLVRRHVKGMASGNGFLP